jgi:hypothetical protein
MSATSVERSSWPSWLRPSAWAYSSATSRDYRLDLLRGFLVLMMIVDHIGGDSLVTLFTGKNQFLVSAAEGFVFVSGALLGIVYGGRIRRLGLATGIRMVLRRAAVLYFATAALTLSFVALLLFTEVPIWMDRSSGLGVDSPFKALIGTLTMHYTYHGTDMLIIYVFMVAASPLAFYALAKGRWAYVLGFSWLIWAVYQIAPAQMVIPWTVENSIFDVAVWQALFYTGLVIGFHRASLAKLSRFLAKPAVLIALVASFIGMLELAMIHLTGNLAELGIPWLTPANFDVIFGKLRLGPGRVVAFFLLAALVWQVLTRFWGPLSLALGWLLLPLGQRALFAYGAHLFLIGPFNAWFGDALYGGPSMTTQATFVHIGAILLVSLMARAYPKVFEGIRATGAVARRLATSGARAIGPSELAPVRVERQREPVGGARQSR